MSGKGIAAIRLIMQEVEPLLGFKDAQRQCQRKIANLSPSKGSLHATGGAAWLMLYRAPCVA